jgi:hypothetical protein
MPEKPDAHAILKSLHFAGRTGGSVKSLSGFKKGHHTAPDAVNATTSAFLAKLCAQELATEAEEFFQRARAALEYKRKDISVDLGAGTAVVSSKDFVVEVEYGLLESAPDEYTVKRTLHSVRSSDFLALPQCDELFAGLFHDVVFVLTRGAPVEKVIDAIEAAETALRVDYPSDCRHCAIHVPEVDTQVFFDGRELVMSFSRTASPRALWEQFLEVRHAFALSKDVTLAGLIAA